MFQNVSFNNIRKVYWRKYIDIIQATPNYRKHKSYAIIQGHQDNETISLNSVYKKMQKKVIKIIL